MNGLSSTVYTFGDEEKKISVVIFEGNLWIAKDNIAKLYDKEEKEIDLIFEELIKDKHYNRLSVVRKARLKSQPPEEGRVFYRIDAVVSIGKQMKAGQAEEFSAWGANVLKSQPLTGTIEQHLLWEQIEEPKVPIPMALLVSTWVLVGISAFSYFLGVFGMLVSLAILPCGIFLIISKNRAARINGIIVTSIWGVTFILGFVMAAIGWSMYM